MTTSTTTTTEANANGSRTAKKGAAKKGKSGASSGGKVSATVTAGRAVKPAAQPKTRPQSAIACMREVLAGNPHATVEEIAAVLDKRGLSKSPVTIATIKSDFWGTYRALAKAGALKSPVVH